jgi:hypothetical protein
MHRNRRSGALSASAINHNIFGGGVPHVNKADNSDDKMGERRWWEWGYGTREGASENAMVADETGDV